MKQKDLGVLLIAGIVGAVFSMVASNMLFGDSSSRSEKVPKVQEIKTSFDKPSEAYFNENSINPTRIIRISPNEEDKNPAFNED